MKRIKFLTIIAFLSLLLINNTGYSQIKYAYTFEYSTAFNTGDANTYIDKPSWGGFSTAFKGITSKKLTYGLEVGWNIFNMETTGTTTFTNGAITGYQARYYNYVPILANIGYAFQNTRQSKIMPYAQANVGGYYITQQFQAGVTTIEDENFHFGFGPEAGFIYKASQTVGISFNVKWNYALSAGEGLNGQNSETDFSFFNVNLGIGYIQ